MSYILIVCEKPQAAQKIAESFEKSKKIKINNVNVFECEYNKNKIKVGSCVGHLFGLSEKGGESWQYPVFESEWKEIYKTNKQATYTKDYIKCLKSLKKDASEIIVATDFDVEGEVIGYNAIKHIFKIENASRMKFSSLTKDSIKKAFENRSKTIEIGQKEAGLTRHQLDWLYGINLSRAFTQAIKNGANKFKVLSTGRVQAPTLHFLCNKEKEISKFKSQKYYEIYLDGIIKSEKIRAQYFDENKKNIEGNEENENEKILYYATSNETKLKRVQMLVSFFDRKIKVLQVPNFIEVEENEKTLLENSQKKLKPYLDKNLKFPILSLDTGIFMSGSKVDPIKPKRSILEMFKKNEKDLSKKEISKIMFEFFTDLAKEKNQKGEEYKFYFEDCFSILFDGKIESFSYKRHSILMAEPKGKLDEYFPLLNLYVDDKTKKYYADKNEKDFKIEFEEEIDFLKNELENIFNIKEDDNLKLLNDKYKLTDGKKVKKIIEETKNKNGKIKDNSGKKFKQSVPIPFDLTSLQMEASNLFGISPKRTLEIAQNLYVNGWTSYPRTSSQKFKDTDLKSILKKLEKFPNYNKLVKKVFDINKSLKPKEGKKDDPAHPAIHPTGELPRKLEGQDEKIYDLIVKRFLSVFGKDAIKETNKIIIDIEKNLFELKATRIIEKNWIELYEPYNKSQDIILPKCEIGEIVENKKVEEILKETTPPKRFTDATIIKELEKRGIGTKATRAEILNNLKERGYIIDKSIKVTNLGLKMDEVISNEIPKICDEKLTREFEEEMNLIRSQKRASKNVIEKAEKELSNILKDIKKNEINLGKKLDEANKDAEFEKAKIRKCLKCDGWLCVKTAIKTRSKFLGCSNYPKCKEIYSLPKVAMLKPLKDSDEDSNSKEFIYIMAGNTPRNIKKILVNEDKKDKEKQLKKDSKKYKEVGSICPKCNKGKFVLRKNYYGGEFLGCDNYPKCKTLIPISKEGVVEIDKMVSK